MLDGIHPSFHAEVDQRLVLDGLLQDALDPELLDPVEQDKKPPPILGVGLRQVVDDGDIASAGEDVSVTLDCLRDGGCGHGEI